MATKTCTVSNCNSKHKARGFCMAHYMTELRHENGTYSSRRKPRTFTCSADGCIVRLSNKGLCGTHYAMTHMATKRPRQYKPVVMKQELVPCVDCGAPSFSNNMCQLHYNEFKMSPESAEGFWQFVKKELNLV